MSLLTDSVQQLTAHTQQLNDDGVRQPVMRTVSAVFVIGTET